MYEPDPKYIQSKEEAEKSKDALLVLMRDYIEKYPQKIDEIVQVQNVTREEALRQLGFNEIEIKNLLARM